MNKYSTIGPRIVALILDSFVLVPVVLPVIILAEETTTWRYWGISIGVSVLSNAYQILMHWRFGQTLGKMAVGVKVVNTADQGPITLNQALMRDIPNIAVQLMASVGLFFLLYTGVHPEAEAFQIVETYPGIALSVFTLFNVLYCIFHLQHRALHDLIGGTVVVRLDALAAEEKAETDPPPPSEYRDLRDE